MKGEAHAIRRDLHEVLDQLIKRVNHAAKEGWQPTGSLVIVINQH